jgi:ATP-dependent RNA helicase DHX8/PRP22
LVSFFRISEHKSSKTNRNSVSNLTFYFSKKKFNQCSELYPDLTSAANHWSLNLLRVKRFIKETTSKPRVEAISKMDDLESFEVLSLVSKVVSEMGNYLEIDTETCKALAPFIIEQRVESKSTEEFASKIEDSGAEMPRRLIERIDKLVLTLHPKLKPKSKPTPISHTVSKNTKLTKAEDGGIDLLDDTFAQLEGLARKSGHTSQQNGSKRRYPADYQEERKSRHNSDYDKRSHKKARSRSPIRERGRPERSYPDQGFQNRKPNRKRLTSQERFDLEQLVKSGFARAEDYPELNPDYEDTIAGRGTFVQEEDVDVEVKEERPPFLEHESKRALDLSPIRVVRAPDGSLGRASANGSELVKTVKEMRMAEAREKASDQAARRNQNGASEDPMGNMSRDARNQTRDQQLQDYSAQANSWKKEMSRRNQSLGKRTNLSIKEQRESLPVYKFRNQFLQAIKDNQLLVVVGETGSGKTTQLTQYLAEAGYAKKGKGVIGCTQPRRVAAISVAKRVSEEVGCQVGEDVGYTIRFEDCTSPDTVIKYMTDGMLQREILIDPLLNRYSVIMLDEAHERTIATDVLFGLLTKTVKKRSDLKIIVTSATLDAEKFSSFFSNCPIFTIPGRTFPVEINFSKDPVSDYVEESLTTIQEIHLTQPPGDILVFLTGQEEIDTSCEILHERMKKLPKNVPELIILPVYAALPSEMQSLIFEPAPAGKRKVVLATNIAETSITIDHIYYVIDSGFVKQNVYDHKLGMDKLIVTPISQASAKQRAGRAGRTGPGKCFRLYTEAAYQTEMLPTSIPEIQRQNLSMTILMLKAMGIEDVLGFPFMDPPARDNMLASLEELYQLAALDDEGLLTKHGREMTQFPIEQPSLSKALLRSSESAFGCSDEMLTIIAMVSEAQNVFHRPREKQKQADEKKAKFHDQNGDHLTLLNVYRGWKESNSSRPWCFENFIQFRVMKRAEDIRSQLEKIMKRLRRPVVSCGPRTDLVREALCEGMFRNAARRERDSQGQGKHYKTVMEGTVVYMHPSSALFGKTPEYVIYHTLMMTDKEWMNVATTIDPKWLRQAAPSLYKIVSGNEMSKRKKQERIQPLFNRHEGADDWRISAQRRQGRGGGGGTWG